MSRLPHLRRDALDDEGRALYDTLMQVGTSASDAEGRRLAGPYNAWVHAPALGRQLEELRVTLRHHMTLERPLIELAIIVVGAHWRAEFEFWAHARLAREEGLGDGVIDAVRDGSEPPYASDDEAIVHAVARQLLDDGRLGQDLYDRAVSVLGEPALVEIVMIVGYYCMVSFTLNAFEVDLPRGVEPIWPAEEES